MGKVILIPENTDLNRGDQALVWESIRLIKDIDQNSEIILMKGGDRQQYIQTEKLGYPMIHTILKHPGRVFSNREHVRYSLLDIVIMGLVAISDFALTALLLIKNKAVNRFALSFMSNDCCKTYNAFRDCKAVFVKGGGFIHSYGTVTDFYQTYYLLYYFLLAIRHQKDIIVLPNSIGPLKNKWAARLTYYVLNHCRYISVRESVSEKFLLAEGKIKKEISRHSDLGFFLQSATDFDAKAYLKRFGVDISKSIIGVTLRPYRFPGEKEPEKKYRNYINSFIAFVIYLGRSGHQVVLFSHTLGPSAHENDTLAVKEVTDELSRQQVPYVSIKDSDLDCRQVMSIYSEFDFLIGTRFHSVIFAQNSYVPTIAISYGGNKGSGIMMDSGLADYSIPINEISENKLITTFDKLNSNRMKVRELLKEQRKLMVQDRNDMIKEIKQLFGG